MKDAGEGPIIRACVRAAWRFRDGRTVVCTVRRDPAGSPEDEGRGLASIAAFIAEVSAAGDAFPDGRGTLLAVIGTMAG